MPRPSLGKDRSDGAASVGAGDRSLDGIGAALARLFAADGHQLALVARHEAGLATLAGEIEASGAPRPLVLPFDLSRGESAGLVSAQLSAKGWEPAIVVNNAGFGLLGSAGALDRVEQLQMIDLNVRALTDLTLRFLPAVMRHQGGILNVASVAGFLPGPGMTVYYATKAFVLSFSEALAEELAGSSTTVTVLCPGPVPTAFQARSGMSLERMPKFMMRSADEVARAGYDGFKAGRRVVVPGLANKLATRFVGLLPRRLLLAAVMRQQRRRAPHRPGTGAAAGQADGVLRLDGGGRPRWMRPDTGSGARPSLPTPRFHSEHFAPRQLEASKTIQDYWCPHSISQALIGSGR